MAESGGVSDDSKEKAEQFKNDANEQFKAEHYDQAIQLYTKVRNDEIVLDGGYVKSSYQLY